MTAPITHFLSTPLLMNTCRVATMRLSIMFSSGSVRGVSSRPVLCFQCCLYTLATHCTVVVSSLLPPSLHLHCVGMARRWGGGDTRTDGNIGRSNFSESFPATFLSFDSFTLLYHTVLKDVRKKTESRLFLFTLNC